MSNYVIFTDSAADIKPELLNKWGVAFISLTFRALCSHYRFHTGKWIHKNI